MGRSSYIVVAIVCALLAGCGQNASTELNQTQDNNETTNATTTVESSLPTLDEYMSKTWASYDEYDMGIAKGTFVPQSLRLIVGDDVDGYVHDKDTIVRTWNALKKIRVDLDHPQTDASTGDFISFDFDSGHDVVGFRFRTAEYAEAHDKTQYRVEDPSEVVTLIEELKPLIDKEKPKVGDELPNENGVYLWDANNDGTLEHVGFDVSANGDEAPNSADVKVTGKKVEASAWIDRFYGKKSVVLREDDKGPYLDLTYYTGDYWNHDGIASCTIRLVGDKLIVEEA